MVYNMNIHGSSSNMSLGGAPTGAVTNYGDFGDITKGIALGQQEPYYLKAARDQAQGMGDLSLKYQALDQQKAQASATNALAQQKLALDQSQFGADQQYKYDALGVQANNMEQDNVRAEAQAQRDSMRLGMEQSDWTDKTQAQQLLMNPSTSKYVSDIMIEGKVPDDETGKQVFAAAMYLSPKDTLAAMTQAKKTQYEQTKNAKAQAAWTATVDIYASRLPEVYDKLDQGKSFAEAMFGISSDIKKQLASGNIDAKEAADQYKEIAQAAATYAKKKTGESKGPSTFVTPEGTQITDPMEQAKYAANSANSYASLDSDGQIKRQLGQKPKTSAMDAFNAWAKSN